MKYRVTMLRRARRELDSLSQEVGRRIVEKIDALSDDLAGDVKRLTRFSAEYRLRVGDYRVLFDVQDDQVLVQVVRHRGEAYGR